MTKFYAQILLPNALNDCFTYLAEATHQVGDVVLVEFGAKEIWGVICEITQQAPQNLAENKVKKILEIQKSFKFSAAQLRFINEIAQYNLASRGLVLRAFMGILNSDKTKKEAKALVQQVYPDNFFLKKLSPKQQEIADQLISYQNSETSKIALLDGVTGSGKTEIYFAAIAEILKKTSRHSQQNQVFEADKNLNLNNDDQAQILILLPEISLTSQLLLRFEQQFGFSAALWHSKISPKNKREIFQGIISGSVRVLIGARSALLLPFKNLRLIVVDEEHDTSLKQEDVFNFHARDMAILKARIENFPIILSSATPALETYNNALSGKFEHFLLEQKFGSKNEIKLIDLRQEKLNKNEFLSQNLRQEIAKNLALNKQSLLFLNRRGYAPITLCQECGKKYQCPSCDFNLVLHKSKNLLVCHHCGHNEKPQKKCLSCSAEDKIISLGVGVEKLEEEVKRTFPQARVALITSDNVGNFAEVDALVKQILANEIDIIIGTQMIAKGHDFSNLNLVGIVDADSMLYSSEIRALEKTYQLLTQVVGRTGRSTEAGKVLIQTYNPENFLFGEIQKNDKKSFYEFELNNRRSLDLPPFSRLAKFEISSLKEIEAKNFAKEFIKHFPIDERIEIFGPAPAPLQRLKNRHHFLVNLKASRKINLQKLIADVSNNLKIPSSIRLRIDIDPV